MCSEGRPKLVELEREDREHCLDGVERDREADLDGGPVDRVVLAVAVQRADAGGRQVDADELGVPGVAADVGGARLGVLGRHDERPLQRVVLEQPPLVEPPVVRTRQRDGEAGVADHREVEQVVGEEHGLVHAQVVEARAQLGGGGHDLATVRPAGERDAELRPRRHPGQVEVPLVDLRDLAQTHVPGRVRVLGERGRILVDVHVGVDDIHVLERLPRGRRYGCCLGHVSWISLAAIRCASRTSAENRIPWPGDSDGRATPWRTTSGVSSSRSKIGRYSSTSAFGVEQARWT